jgi:hypothetical protein
MEGKRRNEIPMDNFFSRYFRTNPMQFSHLYKQFCLFVKSSSWYSLVIGKIRGILRVLLVLDVPLQQGQCLTAEEIAYLKKAGVSDETIQLMIEQEDQHRQHSQTGIWEVEDEKGNRSTIYHVGDDKDAAERRRVEQEKIDRAWEMLKYLIIDTREKD